LDRPPPDRVRDEKAEQFIGWNPDLNDGVRLNIRPFMTAGILRKNPNIKWIKDRGTEPKCDKDLFPWFWNGDTFTGERVNDVHLAIKDKSSHGLNIPARRETRIKIN
jgi:hypothetical protein